MRLWLLRYDSYIPEIASAPRYDVVERSDHVEVRGVSGNDVLEALRLLDTVRGTPPASVAQAQRLATGRDALLATPVLTYDTLQLLRGEPKESSTRTWFARRAR